MTERKTHWLIQTLENSRVARRISRAELSHKLGRGDHLWDQWSRLGNATRFLKSLEKAAAILGYKIKLEQIKEDLNG